MRQARFVLQEEETVTEDAVVLLKLPAERNPEVRVAPGHCLDNSVVDRNKPWPFPCKEFAPTDAKAPTQS
jgi:hypothetical protein